MGLQWNHELIFIRYLRIVRIVIRCYDWISIELLCVCEILDSSVHSLRWHFQLMIRMTTLYI